ncbi:MAG: hypothetical protein HYX76_14580 [Acidobacteria bacterium]|nr:hypothetical protein [Acidobacteriota bacterium]
MSGETAARELQAKFDEIRSAELARLQKRIAPLSIEHRTEVEAIAAEVIDAIAAHLGGALRQSGEPHLVDAVVSLFGVSGESTHDLPAR